MSDQLNVALTMPIPEVTSLKVAGTPFPASERGLIQGLVKNCRYGSETLPKPAGENACAPGCAILLGGASMNTGDRLPARQP